MSDGQIHTTDPPTPEEWEQRFRAWREISDPLWVLARQIAELEARVVALERSDKGGTDA